MLKPNGYDEVSVSDFVPAEVGGHQAIIKALDERKSATGKDMIVVCYDFAPNDKQPGFFMDQFEKDIRPEKKWPYAGTKYIMVMDYNEPTKTSKDFKRFITSVEESNPGFVTAWGDNFASQFKDKRVGVVFGLVESEYEGKTSMRSEPRWFCSADKAKDASVPEPKYLKKGNAPVAKDSSFVAVAPGTDAEIPF